MIPLTLAELADVVGGEAVDPAAVHRSVNSVSIDSRATVAGALFVPLPGEHADGHDFVADAFARGAAGCLWSVDRPDPPLGAVVVDDPADALLGLGGWVRDTVAPIVVAITGSSGKTTTKDLVAAAAAAPSAGRAGRRIVASEGSYNNELGVPLTCCRLEADSDVLVAEVGSRGIGHIARLMPLLRPDIAVVTCVGSSHLATLGAVADVARAKAELVEGLDEAGLAVLNGDDHRVRAMAERAPGRVVTYGQGPDVDWRGVDVAFDELARPAFGVRTRGGGDAGIRVRPPLPGLHNVGNALAALAVADALGVAVTDAAAALGDATVSRWRMQVLRTPAGVTVLNDAYNANPESVEAALRTLVQMAATRRWAVLGHMAELGTVSADAHERVGRLCAELAVDRLIVVGEAARGMYDAARDAYAGDDLVFCPGPEQAASLVAEAIAPGDAVLVKASRTVGLERVADELVGP